MSHTQCARRLEAIRDAIAEYVIRGNVPAAQSLAVDYAIVRDQMLTFSELVSAARATVTA